MVTKKDVDDAINLTAKKTAHSIAESIVKDPNSSHVNKDELRNTLEQCIQSKEERERIDRGFGYIVKYMDSRLSPIEIHEIKENWSHGLDRFFKLFEQKNQLKEVSQPSSLLEIMEISDSNFEKFYASGVYYYEAKMFQEASDVFFVLAFLSNARHHVWISFGLSEYQCGRLEEALKAFAMAAITNINDPLPYLYSAQCCIEMANKVEAELYIQIAEEKIKQDPIKNKKYQDELVKIKQLLNR